MEEEREDEEEREEEKTEEEDRGREEGKRGREEEGREKGGREEERETTDKTVVVERGRVETGTSGVFETWKIPFRFFTDVLDRRELSVWKSLF